MRMIYDHLSAERVGSTRGRDTKEQILKLRLLIKKAQKYDIKTILCLVHYKKVFDCVQWQKLWQKLWQILLEMNALKHLV